MTMYSLQSVLIAGFVLIHIFAGKLRFLDGIPRSVWLSMAGGISVSYVFLHIFPELGEAQHALERQSLVELVEQHAYLLALLGLVAFYGLERAVKTSRAEAGGGSPAALFWLHIASFAVYNALVGYLLFHRDTAAVPDLVFFYIAMGLHFLVNDYGLRQDHQQDYHRVGRWVLAAAVAGGWLLAHRMEFSEQTTAAMFALLAGGIVLNVLKEELPEERRSRFSAFAAGAFGYALLLQIV